MTRLERLALVLVLAAGVILGLALGGWEATPELPHGGIGTAATATAAP